MFRILMVIGLIMAVSVPAFAEEREIGLYLGGKIGPSAVLVLGEDTDDLDAAPGMAVGAMFKVSLLEHLALQAEFLYEMKGFSFDQTIPPAGTIHFRQFTHYLSLPIIAKGVFEVAPVTIEPYAGLALSLLVDAEGVATNGNQEQSSGNTGDFNAIDLGVVFGGEVWFALAESIYLTGDIRFNFGVIDIIDGPNDNGVYNCAIQFLLGAGYKF